MRLMRSLLSIMLLVAVLSGCMSKKKPQLEEFDPNEPVTLKVMFTNKDFFFMKYGNQLMSKFPNIDIEVVETAGDKERAIGEEPDVFVSDSITYEKLAADARLMDLDPLIQQDEFDTAGIYEPVLTALREQGNGKLYGLAPEFSTYAMFFNIDLFRKYGVELPRNQMSWEEVMMLAQRFPAGDGGEQAIYGFQSGNGEGIYDLIRRMGDTLGLSMVSADHKLVLQSKGWEGVFRIVNEAYRNGSLFIPKGGTQLERAIQESFTENDLFLNGRSAMRLGNAAYLLQIDIATNQTKKTKPFQWGVVTVPVNPANPEAIDPLSLSTIFAVNVKSEKKRAAWEIVKYINSEIYAKINSKTMFDGSLPTRQAYAKKTEDMMVDPFYALKPSVKVWTRDQTPAGFDHAFGPLVEEQMQSVFEGNLSFEEAMRTLQDQGQSILNDAIAQDVSKSP
jgi:multiple sugar transport system substrate-binding protein